MLLTTQVFAPPVDESSFAGANVGVGCDGRAQTFTVATAVTGAGVEHTAFFVLGGVLDNVAGLEEVRGQDITLLLGPRLALRRT